MKSLFNFMKLVEILVICLDDFLNEELNGNWIYVLFWVFFYMRNFFLIFKGRVFFLLYVEFRILGSLNKCFIIIAYNLLLCFFFFVKVCYKFSYN